MRYIKAQFAEWSRNIAGWRVIDTYDNAVVAEFSGPPGSEVKTLLDADHATVALNVRTKCDCEIDHTKVGHHPSFHDDRPCENYGTEVMTSDYGLFILCPPCANDALSGGYYKRARP